MSDHAEHGVDNPAFDGGTDVDNNKQGCATDQDMSKARRDDTGQEQKSPLLGSDENAPEEAPPAEPVPRKSSTVEISRLLDHGAKRQSEKEGIREGFYTGDSDVPQRYKVDESDYASHRTTEFPQVHPILGTMHPVQLKKTRKISASSAVAPSLPDVTEDPGSDSEERPLLSHIEEEEPVISAPVRVPFPSQGEYTILPAITLPSVTSLAPQPISSAGSSDGQGVTFLIGDEGHDDSGSKLSFLNNLGQNEEPTLSDHGNVTPRLESPHVKFSLGSVGSLDKPSTEAPHDVEAMPPIIYDERPKKKKVPTATLR